MIGHDSSAADVSAAVPRQTSYAEDHAPYAADAALAHDVASAAGQLLVGLRERGGLGPDQLRAEGDRRSHELITAMLRRHRPADAVLSEEGRDDPARLAARRVWIVDPLDGTREFGDAGRTDWAVHVALWCDGRLVAGAVALPALGVTWDSAAPPRMALRGSGPLRILVSRTRPPDFAVKLADALDAHLVPMGSAGAKIMAVVQGGADIYAHAGGQYEWDSAAPVAVAAAAGLHTSRIDGSPLQYNQPDPFQPDVLVCRPDLAPLVLEEIRAAGQDARG